MSLSRLASFGSVLLVVLVLASCSSDSPTKPDDNSIEVDLSTFPATGEPVPNWTVLTDQWESIGILFDAEPAGVDLVKTDFGGSEAHIFFSPDTAGAIAVFSFVEIGGRAPADISTFELVPWFSPGETAELVGLDGGGVEVAIFEVDVEDVGDESTSITMSIQGTFRTVEWRTHGNPGIAARSIVFEF